MGDGLKSARDSSKNLFSNMSQGLKDKASETKKMFNDLKSGIEEGPSGMIKSFTNSVGLRSSTKSLTHMVHNISNNRNQIDQTKLTLRDVVKLQGNDVEIGKHKKHEHRKHPCTQRLKEQRYISLSFSLRKMPYTCE